MNNDDDDVAYALQLFPQPFNQFLIFNPIGSQKNFLNNRSNNNIIIIFGVWNV